MLESNVTEKTLLKIEGLKKYFVNSSGIIKRKVDYIKAVDNVSFSINKGETFGLVGESGCGKSTCGRTIIRLYEPTEGKILYQGKDIAKLPEKELTQYRQKMQMIFQDPYASLNGRMTVLDIVGEPLDIHGKLKGSERESKILQLLEAALPGQLAQGGLGVLGEIDREKAAIQGVGLEKAEHRNS